MLNKIKLGLVALLLPLVAFAQSYPSPTFQNLTVLGTFTGSGNIGLPTLAAQAANTVVANVTAASASPTAVALPSCSTANSALKYTSATGFSCGTTFGLTGGTLAQFAATTSVQLAGIISDETGSGSAVFATSPSLTTPTVAGAALSGTLSGSPTFSGTPVFSNGLNVSGGTVTGVGLIGVQVFTSSGTYTKDAGTQSIIVEVVGQGGGGGGCPSTTSTQNCIGGSGQGGAYARVYYTGSFSPETVTINTTGAGGAAGANPGVAGGSASFGSLVSCPGGGNGAAGSAFTATSPSITGPATLSGACTISGGTTIVSTVGQYPQISYALGVLGLNLSGIGGGSPLGAGGNANAGTGAGTTGGGRGAAGSGGVSSNGVAQAGGNPSGGAVIVYEFN